jgi:glycerol-3-phosphate dehydrogenase (NAD(P)+)
VVSATPAQVLRQVWSDAVAALRPEAVIVSASKGVEVGTTRLMSEVFDEVIPGPIAGRLAYLSGPSFAKEMAAGHPTAVVVAALDEALGVRVQQLFSTSVFRVYTTDDVVGVELGGALKNVIAIAVGVAEGMGLGTNSRAALITRGLAEVSRLAVAAGANPLTLAGLAGVGDLVLTCTGHLSRNLQVGIRLGQGETLAEILGSMKMVAEGVETARSTADLARRHGIEMPITDVVVGLLDSMITPADAVQGLMTRKLRSEREF